MTAAKDQVGSLLVALDVAQVSPTRTGLRQLVARSKSDQAGAGAEIGISRGGATETCPVAALKAWLKSAEIHDGPLFRKVTRWNTVVTTRLSADAVRQILLKRAALAGIKGTRLESVTPHGMRAGFVTTAYRNGVPDEEIMGHPPSRPAHDARLRTPDKAQPRQPRRETRVVVTRSPAEYSRRGTGVHACPAEGRL